MIIHACRTRLKSFVLLKNVVKVSFVRLYNLWYVLSVVRGLAGMQCMCRKGLCPTLWQEIFSSVTWVVLVWWQWRIATSLRNVCTRTDYILVYSRPCCKELTTTTKLKVCLARTTPMPACTNAFFRWTGNANGQSWDILDLVRTFRSFTLELPKIHLAEGKSDTL